MKKTKQILIRLSEEDLIKINELCIAENSTISGVIRELINFRHGYLKKNKKINIKEKVSPDVENNNLDPELIAEFRRLMS